jgi:hypothetical protein
MAQERPPCVAIDREQFGGAGRHFADRTTDDLTISLQ